MHAPCISTQKVCCCGHARLQLSALGCRTALCSTAVVVQHAIDAVWDFVCEATYDAKSMPPATGGAASADDVAGAVDAILIVLCAAMQARWLCSGSLSVTRSCDEASYGWKQVRRC